MGRKGQWMVLWRRMGRGDASGGVRRCQEVCDKLLHDGSHVRVQRHLDAYYEQKLHT